MNELVLVTGGSGFVAGHRVVSLLRRGYRVRATLRSPAKEVLVGSSPSTVVDASEPLTSAIADLDRDEGWA